MRAWLLAGWVALVGVAGAEALRAAPETGPAGVACAEVFDGPLAVAPLHAGAEEPYVLTATLRADRPAAVVQAQIIDRQGFGWILRPVGAGALATWTLQLPRVPDTHTIRVAVLTPAEAERAGAVRAAARAFDLRAWIAARGWAGPRVSLCRTFELGDG